MKVGNIVKLITGSPLMIVVAPATESTECQWFNGASLTKATFPTNCLRLASTEEIEAKKA